MTTDLIPLVNDRPRPTLYLWQRRIPLESLTSLQGDGGAGKSTYLRWLAARVTQGDLPGDLVGPANVLWLNVEENVCQDIRPGLDAQGADVSRVFRLRDTGQVLSFPADLAKLRKYVKAHAIRLVVIDQANTFIDANKIRQALQGLRKIAEQNDCAIILNRNTNGAKDVYRAGKGGAVITDICRSNLHLGMHPDGDGTRVLVSVKQNATTANRNAVVITTDANGRIQIGEEIELTARELLPSGARGEYPTKIEAAVAWLREHLAGKELRWQEVEDAALAEGISPRTLRRARELLGVRNRRVEARNEDGSRTSQTLICLPDFVPVLEAVPAPPARPSEPPGQVGQPGQVPSGDDSSTRFALLEMDAGPVGQLGQDDAA